MAQPRRIAQQTGRHALVDDIAFQMPVQGIKSSTILAAFPCDPVKARVLLQGDEVHPFVLWNKALLLVTVVDYRHTNIGRYIEFSIALACTHGGRPAPPLLPALLRGLYGTGQWVYDLPVSTEVSVKGGKGIWGMPKHQANLNYIEGQRTVSSQYRPGRPARRLFRSGTSPFSLAADQHKCRELLCVSRAADEVDDLFLGQGRFFPVPQGRRAAGDRRCAARAGAEDDRAGAGPGRHALSARSHRRAGRPFRELVLRLSAAAHHTTGGAGKRRRAGGERAMAAAALSPRARADEGERARMSAGAVPGAANHATFFAPQADYAGPRRSLILAGGGMRVAYQAGVLQALAEAGLCFHHADGTSGGTMNLAMLLSGLTPQEMVARWRALDPKDFMGFMPLADYLRGPDLPAMGSADGVVNKVFPQLGIDVARINEAVGIAGTFNLCNFSRKTLETIEHTALSLDLLVAGVSLPIFMPAVQKDGAFYTDGVWIKDANLMEAVRRGADEIWLVWCIGNSSRYYDGAFRQYVHMIEMSANGALFEELDRISEINARIAGGEPVGGRHEPIVLHVIRPDYPLPLDPDYFFGRIDGATLIALGYADAKAYLASRRPGGLPLTPEITHMHDETIGISFRETMAGGFALGETDPGDGTAEGRDSRNHARAARDGADPRYRPVSERTGASGLAGRVDRVRPVRRHGGRYERRVQPVQSQRPAGA